MAGERSSTADAARPFADRTAAGRSLARALEHHRGDGTLVLGLPRGGVPVAGEVARALGAPLDVVVVRKIGAPRQPELAVGAVAGVGGRVEVVRNERLLALLRVRSSTFERAARAQVEVVHDRERAFRGGRPPPPLAGRSVVVVDDGLATGSTMLAAVTALRRHGPSRLVVAVPVGAADTCATLAREVDELVCLWCPEPFLAVGCGYVDFAPTSDDEVRRVIAAQQ